MPSMARPVFEWRPTDGHFGLPVSAGPVAMPPCTCLIRLNTGWRSRRLTRSRWPGAVMFNAPPELRHDAALDMWFLNVASAPAAALVPSASATDDARAMLPDCRDHQEPPHRRYTPSSRGASPARRVPSATSQKRGAKAHFRLAAGWYYLHLCGRSQSWAKALRCGGHSLGFQNCSASPADDQAHRNFFVVGADLRAALP